jgi:uncharacterized RDD family membrane protein YckC
MAAPRSSATLSKSLAGAAPAGPLRRLLATLVDMVLFCGLCTAIAWPVVAAVDWTTLPSDVDGFLSTVSDPQWISHASGVLGMWIALWWCYFVVGWGLFGATPGKWLLGIRIVDHKYRYPIGISRALMRLFSYGVSSLTLGFGHLLAVFRGERLALHDSLAGTRVVCSRRQPSAEVESSLPNPGKDEPAATTESQRQ